MPYMSDEEIGRSPHINETTAEEREGTVYDVPDEYPEMSEDPRDYDSYYDEVGEFDVNDAVEMLFPGLIGVNPEDCEDCDCPDCEPVPCDDECDCEDCVPADFQESIVEENCDCEACVEAGTAEPAAPEGYEWVLMPERPGGANHGGAFRSPGETGHYSNRNPEPIQVAEAWDLDPNEFNILKYMARWRSKGGIESLEKVKFYADREIMKARREGVN